MLTLGLIDREDKYIVDLLLAVTGRTPDIAASASTLVADVLLNPKPATGFSTSRLGRAAVLGAEHHVVGAPPRPRGALAGH